MISLIRFIRSFFERESIIQVRRVPPTKNFRAHFTGLTLGFIFVILNFSFDLVQTGAVGILLWFAFITYWGGPFFFIAIILFFLLQALSPATGSLRYLLLIETNWYLLGYGFGVIFAILYNDLVYLYLNWSKTEKKKIKVAFFYNRAQKINIIKSPHERQETVMLNELKPLLFYVRDIEKNLGNRVRMHESAIAIRNLVRQAYGKMSVADQGRLMRILSVYSSSDINNKLEELRDNLDSGNAAALRMVANQVGPLAEKYLKLKEKRLYNYKLATPPEQPYTIAFVANPKIRKRGEPENDSLRYENDPLSSDIELFLRSVDRALFSLEQDEIIGRPEFWSRIRVLTVFDPELVKESGPNFGLVQEFQETATQDGKLIDHNLIEPRRLLNDNFMRIFDRSWQTDHSNGTLDETEHPKFKKHEIDLIFAMTASPTHVRSMAHYSDWLALETDAVPPLVNILGREGIPFEFSIDPDKNKETYNTVGEAVKPLNNVFPHLEPNAYLNPSNFARVHDFYATEPGRVAVNVLSARLKTYRHEFAHAMSSVFHGTICDEYADYFRLEEQAEDEEHKQDPHFYVNRINRNQEKMLSARPIPIPKLFARYNMTRYSSDLTPVSAEESWLGYFPDKFDKTTPCTMDADYGRYRFDELLSMFLYDRLMAKTIRLPRP